MIHNPADRGAASSIHFKVVVASVDIDFETSGRDILFEISNLLKQQNDNIWN